MYQQTVLGEAGGQVPGQTVHKSKVLGRQERMKRHKGNQSLRKSMVGEGVSTALFHLSVPLPPLQAGVTPSWHQWPGLS